MKKSGFTLIEMVVVLVVITILTAVTMKLNRSQIGETSSMNERESWIARHEKHNNIATNTNYINGIKIDEIVFEYSTTGILMNYSGGEEKFHFSHNILSGDHFTIKKQTLKLGCEIENNNSQTVELLFGADKSKRFILDSKLCTWKSL